MVAGRGGNASPMEADKCDPPVILGVSLSGAKGLARFARLICIGCEVLRFGQNDKPFGDCGSVKMRPQPIALHRPMLAGKQARNSVAPIPG